MKKILFLLFISIVVISYSIYNYGFNYSYLQIVKLFSSQEVYDKKINKFIFDDKMYEKTSFLSIINSKNFDYISLITKKTSLEDEIIDKLIKLENDKIIKQLLKNDDLVKTTLTRLIIVGNKEQKEFVASHENIPQEAILKIIERRELSLMQIMFNNKLMFPRILNAYKQYLEDNKNFDFIGTNTYKEFNTFKSTLLGDYEDILYFVVANKNIGLYELIYLNANDIKFDDKKMFRYRIEPQFAKGIEYFSYKFEKARQKAKPLGINSNKLIFNRLNKIGANIKKHTQIETSYDGIKMKAPTLPGIAYAAGKAYYNKHEASKKAPKRRESVLRYHIKAEIYSKLNKKISKASSKELIFLWKQLVNANEIKLYGSLVSLLAQMKKINNRLLDKIVEDKIVSVYKMMSNLNNLPKKYKKIFIKYK